MHKHDDLNFERLKKQFYRDRKCFEDSEKISQLGEKHTVRLGKVKTLMPVSFIAADYLPGDNPSGIIKAQHQGYKIANEDCAQMIATPGATPKLYNFYWEQISALWGDAQHNSIKLN